MGGPRVEPLRGLDQPETVAYLAGLIDGEGTIGIYTARGVRSLSPSFYLQVTVTNTSVVLMEWLVSTIGSRVDMRADAQSRPATHKQPYHWRVHGPNAGDLLVAVRPYLVIKREQADVGLELRSTHRQGTTLTAADVELRQALKDRMHELNRRGVVA